MLGCVGGGLFAGISLGLASAAQKDRRFTFLGAATLLAGLAGLLGCTLVGVAGMAGMLAAVVAVSLPLAIVMRPYPSG
jgi:hypothetical protein